MPPVFVDTSALYAVLAADDPDHQPAADRWHRLLDQMTEDGTTPVTHSGIVTDVSVLVQRRLGMDALRALLDDIVPLLDVIWIDTRLHREAAVATLAAGQRTISLVDWTSFLAMRAQAITVAFAFDDDFAAQGFQLL